MFMIGRVCLLVRACECWCVHACVRGCVCTWRPCVRPCEFVCVIRK